jgi:hypothetical protein
LKTGQKNCSHLNQLSLKKSKRELFGVLLEIGGEDKNGKKGCFSVPETLLNLFRNFFIICSLGTLELRNLLIPL